MATSHYCDGKWRDGTVSECPKHKKLSARQPTVHRGVGSPGGFKSAKPASDSTPKPAGKDSSAAKPSGAPKPSGSKGSD